MAVKYLSNRVKDFKVGIKSFSESKTSLTVIGNVGIGTANPTDVVGVSNTTVLAVGILTAYRIYSTVYGEFQGGGVTADNIVGSALSISGISTLGTVKISSGIVTATSGVVTYYGDGSNLTGTATPGIVTTGTSTFENITVSGNAGIGSLNVTGVTTLGGNIFLGNDATDEINASGRYISSLVPLGSDQYDLGTSGKDWKDLFLTGNAGIGSLTVSGISTLNGDLFVEATTDTNQLNVTGVSTFRDDLTLIGASANAKWNKTLNRFDFPDATSVVFGNAAELKIHTSGTTPIIEVADNKDLNLNANTVAISTNLTVGGISTFTGNINANGNIVGDSATNITGIAGVTASTLTGTLQTAAQPNITSVGTLSSLDVTGDVSIGGTLTYEDVTNVDSIGIVTARGGIRIGAGTTVGPVSGIITYYGDGSGLTNIGIDTSGTSTFENITVDGNAGIGSLNVTGVSTFAGTVDINGYLDVGGNAKFSNVTGVTTFYSTLDSAGSTDGSVVMHGGLGVSKDVNFGADFTVIAPSSVSTFNGSLKANNGIHVTSGVTTAGIITGATYYGDGSNLTGVSTTGATGGWNPDSQYNLYAGTLAGADSDADTCCNIGIGYSALSSNCAGDKNIAIGACAGTNVLAGGCNIFLGAYAGIGTGDAGNLADNIAIGKAAGCCLSNTYFNVIIGMQAGQKVSTGHRNILIGKFAGCEGPMTGQNNTYLGEYAGRCTTSGDDNIGLGRFSQGTGVITGDNNISIGCKAANNLTSSSDSIVIGRDALTTEDANGSGVIAIGWEALKLQNASTSVGGTIGKNIAIGEKAGSTLVDATENVFLGYYAGKGVLGSKNIAIGSKTFQSTTSGQLNVAIGLDAAKANTGSNNVVIGGNAVSGGAGDGTGNVVVGQYAGYAITDGDKNVLLGQNAGDTITTGCCNVLIGNGVDAASGSDKTFKIGIDADTWISGDGSFNTTLAGIVTAYASGIVSATSYYGDGSNLTGTGGETLISGITVQEESSTVGTAGSITILDFQGATVTAAASGSNKAVITVAGAGSTDGWIADAQQNLYAGTSAGASSDADTRYNVAVGYKAGCSLKACAGGCGSYNLYFGTYAGLSDICGYDNIVMGRRAKCHVDTGGYQVIIGYNAGRCATGSCGVLLGSYAGFRATGADNVFIGKHTGYYTAAGACNLAIGYMAGACIAGGSNNVALGPYAGCSIDTGSGNVYIGHKAGRCWTGSNQLAIGYDLNKEWITGDSNLNVGIGTTIATNAVGAGNTAVLAVGILTAYQLYGDGSCLTNVSAAATDAWAADSQENLVAGNGAGAARDADTCFNIMIGCNAGAALNEGDKNILMGQHAGKALTSGSRNIIFGVNGACNFLTTQSDNVFIGSYTGISQASSNNIAIGNQAAIKCFTAGVNVAIGWNAGCGGTGSTLSATANVFVGKYAGRNITSGDSNVFLGERAGGQAEVTGNYNIAFGKCSAASLTSGANNIALGQSALGTGTVSGNGNISIGGHSALNLADGNWHIFIGCCAGTSQTTAEHDVFIGYLAGGCNDDTGYNVAIGCRAGRDVDGSDNVFLGRGAGAYVSHSSSNACKNTFLGACAAYSAGVTDDGSCNIAIGYYARLPEPTGSNQLVIGIGNSVGWINGNANMNVGIGTTNPDITVGAGNTAKLSVGIVSAYQLYGDGSNLSGVGFSPDDDGNLVAGTHAGQDLDGTTGCYNVFIGQCAGKETTEGNCNVFLGVNAGKCTTCGCSSVFIGKDAGCKASGATPGCNTAIGADAMRCASSAYENTAIGYRAIGNNTFTGVSDTAIGKYAGCNLSSGQSNTLIGESAGKALTASGGNTFIGKGAGSCGSTNLCFNVFVGCSAGYNQTTGCKNVLLGCRITAPITDGSDQFAIGQETSYNTGVSKYWIMGNANFNVGIGTTNPDLPVGSGNTAKLSVGVVSAYQYYGVGSNLSGVSTASDFNSTSDIRLKTNIQPIEDPLAKVIKIEGVSFNWKEDNRSALGVIADQVEKILPQLVHGDDPKTVNYNGLIGLLIEAVKEQQTQIDKLNNRISKLE